jgi:hypothetical protein
MRDFFNDHAPDTKSRTDPLFQWEYTVKSGVAVTPMHSGSALQVIKAAADDELATVK